MKKHTQWFLIIIVLLGAFMRMPITMISPLLGKIATSFNFPAGALGGITTVPLLCFAVVSPFAPRLAARYGNGVVLFTAMIVLTIANYLRVFTIGTLFVGTFFIGLAIAMLNVLVPATIAEKYPQQLGSVTGLYTFSMTLFSAVTISLSAPVAESIGWQATVQSVSIIGVLGLIIWLPHLKERDEKSLATVQKNQSLWGVRAAWYLTAYMGIQSLVFYTIVTWMPTILVSHGMTNNTASLMLGISQLASLPSAYVVPNLAGKKTRHTGLILFFSVFYILSLLLLIIPTTSLFLVATLSILLGFSSNAAFVLAIAMFSLKTSNSRETAAISGMAQSAGYLLAAIGPIGFGLTHDLTHSWTPPLLILVTFLVIMTLAGFAIGRKKTVFE